jgi:hypothetical protein
MCSDEKKTEDIGSLWKSMRYQMLMGVGGSIKLKNLVKISLVFDVIGNSCFVLMYVVASLLLLLLLVVV